MDWTNLSVVDYVILSVIGISVITGLFRGFIRELMAIGVWAIAFWGAIHFSKLVSTWLVPWIHQTEFRGICSFILIMIAIFILGGIFTSFLSYIINHSGLTGTDRILGMVFGWVRGVLIISLMIIVAKIAGFSDEDYVKKSKFYVQFTPIVKWMNSYVPVVLSKMKTLDIQSQQMVLTEQVRTMTTLHD